MSCTDAYPETVKSQEQMLLNFLILQAVSKGIKFSVFDSSPLSFRAERSVDPESRSVVYHLVFNPLVYLNPGSSPG